MSESLDRVNDNKRENAMNLLMFVMRLVLVENFIKDKIQQKKDINVRKVLIFFMTCFVLCSIQMPVMTRSRAGFKLKFTINLIKQSFLRLKQTGIKSYLIYVKIWLAGVRISKASVRTCLGSVSTSLGRVRRCLGQVRRCLGQVRRCLGWVRTCLGDVRMSFSWVSRCLNHPSTCLGMKSTSFGYVRTKLGQVRSSFGRVSKSFVDKRSLLAKCFIKHGDIKIQFEKGKSMLWLEYYFHNVSLIENNFNY